MTESRGWQFRIRGRAEVNSDPIQGEFFTEQQDADKLIRETIQNALDAGTQDCVRVRITFSGSRHALAAADAEPFVSGLKPHLVACGAWAPEGDPMPFLTIEDFSTRGLTGDPLRDRDPSDSDKDDFYWFWRNVGRSAKTESRRGRWGVGKWVLPASSTINSFFGLTIRELDPQPLLMGQSVLKLHQQGGSLVDPYGFYARFDADGFQMPIIDPEEIERFRDVFRLTRKVEPGLSLVIPHPNVDLASDAITRSVIRNYFFPIIAGELIVEVQDGDSSDVLDADNIGAIAEAIDWREDPKTSAEIIRTIQLARWAVTTGMAQATHLPLTDGAPQWTQGLFGDLLPSLRQRYQAGDLLAFAVPVMVRKQNEEAAVCEFFVFIERDAGLWKSDEHYIREGITISGIQMAPNDPIRGIVVVPHGALADLLGDAEGPAHLEWLEREARVRENYYQGVSALRFVKNSLKQLSLILGAVEQEEDAELLTDIFYVETGGNPGPGPGPTPPPPPPPPPPRPQVFRLSQSAGGFTLRLSRGVEPVGRRGRVTAAYQVRRGNAFRAYDPLDFSFEVPPIEVEVVGADVTLMAENRIEFEVVDQSFEIKAVGFDNLRDLRIGVEEVARDASDV